MKYTLNFISLDRKYEISKTSSQTKNAAKWKKRKKFDLIEHFRYSLTNAIPILNICLSKKLISSYVDISLTKKGKGEGEMHGSRCIRFPKDIITARPSVASAIH